jgi:hypothetical protein
VAHSAWEHLPWRSILLRSGGYRWHLPLGVVWADGGSGYLVAGDDETMSEGDSCMGMTTFGPRLVHVMGGWVQSEEIDKWCQITALPGYSKRNHFMEDLATRVHGRG